MAQAKASTLTMKSVRIYEGVNSLALLYLSTKYAWNQDE